MNDVYGMIRDKQNLIDQHITNPEEKAKMQGLLKESYSAYINPTTADFKQEYDGSELKGKLDINQYAGLKTMEMFDPEKYKQTLAFINSDKPTEYQQSMGLTFDDSGFKMGGVSDSETKGSIDYKIGKETRLRELNNIGATNQYTALVSENNKIKKQFDGTQNAEEKQALSENYANNQKAILNVQNAEKGDDERYPLTAQLKFDNQVKEIFQNAPSVGEYAASKFTNSLITNTGNSIESLVTGLFGSDKDIAEMQAKRIGENQQFENQIYLPDSYKRENSPVLIQPNKELKKQVDDVLKGRDYKNLNDYEKNIVNNIVANNQDKIETVTNPDAGNTKNYFSKSTGYAVAGFTVDIAAFGLKVAALGGLGASASVAEGSVLFMDGFLPAHDKAIAEGKGESEALQYGMLHGGVMA